MSSRPNRSDAHLSAEAEAALEAEAREYYDDAAPKRHTKPSRSEPSAVYVDALVPDAADNSHPELDRFQELEAHTERLVYEGGNVGEEFVETEYYKDLGGVGKQHHTVDTPFFFFSPPSAASSSIIHTDTSIPCMVLSMCCVILTCEYVQIPSARASTEQTGTGFIKMDKVTGASFKLSEDPSAEERHASCKGNPATNEWIPSADTVYPASDKPSRSDS